MLKQILKKKKYHKIKYNTIYLGEKKEKIETELSCKNRKCYIFWYFTKMSYWLIKFCLNG
jgi:hypothetical protein